MSKYEELSKLKELLDSGVLSQEEFEAKKKNILSGADNTAPKKSIKKTFVTILVALAILVIGGYFIVEVLMYHRRILTLHIKKVLKEVH